jgi:hypothetical protein
LREELVIDAHRYTADVAIHIHIIVTHHGQSFKTPPAYQTCTREASAAQRLRSDGQTGSCAADYSSVREEQPVLIDLPVVTYADSGNRGEILRRSKN